MFKMSRVIKSLKKVQIWEFASQEKQTNDLNKTNQVFCDLNNFIIAPFALF